MDVDMDEDNELRRLQGATSGLQGSTALTVAVGQAAGDGMGLIPGMLVGHVIGLVAEADAQVIDQHGGKLVETGRFGPIRTIRKDRRLMVLASKWRCKFCKAYHERNSGMSQCVTCHAPRQDLGSANVQDASELARYESRKKSAVGRRANKAGCGQAALVERKASGEAFDMVQKQQLVRLELGQLEVAIGGVKYLEVMESNMSVIEGFLVVHYLGKVSIAAGAGKAADPSR